MAIKVCDAIMGSGKSSAAITYMNEHPDRKYIYISPYLDEAHRIATACSALHFVEPSNAVPGTRHTKSSHAEKLIESGRNIASTHQSSPPQHSVQSMHRTPHGYESNLRQSPVFHCAQSPQQILFCFPNQLLFSPSSEQILLCDTPLTRHRQDFDTQFYLYQQALGPFGYLP